MNALFTRNFGVFRAFLFFPNCKTRENGKIGSMVKNVRYSGMTPEFWNSCDAVANRDEWHLWGIPVCGKGEPSQVVMVGHGTAPARFQNVSILGD